ncbi:MAG: acylglycerol kinase family protein, partial [Acidimicrobiia bacterium]
MSEWLVLVNPLAGRGRHAARRTREALAAYGVDADVRVPTTPSAMRAAVDAGVDEGRTRFVAVGGDGTANLVADQLLEHPWSTPPVLGLLPG